MSRWKWELVLVALAIGVLVVEVVTAETIRMPSGAFHSVASDIRTTLIKQADFVQPNLEEVPQLPIGSNAERIATDDAWLDAKEIYGEDSYVGDATCGCHASGDACNSGDRCDRGCLVCCEKDPWRLFPNSLCGIRVGGWTSGGYTGNAESPPSKYNGPVTFNDRIDGQVNQVYTYIERPTDSSGCGLDIGGRIDLLYGTDHRFAMARGLETRGDRTNRWNNRRFYGLAVPQAYVELAVSDYKIKLGHFYTIVGFEQVPSANNFFYSHSYTMQYGEPFTHTGMLASYALCDTITLHGGFDRGWDNWEDDNEYLSSLFGATWDNGCGTSLAFAGTSGSEISPISGADDDRFMYSLVLTHAVDDRLSFAIQHDYGIQHFAFAGGQDAEWYGVNSYIFYRLNCCWTAGLRAEWFRDDDGVRVEGLGNGNPIQGAQFAGHFYEVSFGLNYQRCSNLVVRPEVRYDWYNGADNAGAGGRRPFDDGNSSDQFTAAIDLIFSY